MKETKKAISIILDRCLTVEQYALKKGISTRTVRNMIKDNRLKRSCVMFLGQWLILKDDLQSTSVVSETTKDCHSDQKPKSKQGLEALLRAIANS